VNTINAVFIAVLSFAGSVIADRWGYAASLLVALTGGALLFFIALIRSRSLERYTGAQGNGSLERPAGWCRILRALRCRGSASIRKPQAAISGLVILNADYIHISGLYELKMKTLPGF
jgi:hypothetical protein